MSYPVEWCDGDSTGDSSGDDRSVSHSTEEFPGPSEDYDVPETQETNDQAREKVQRNYNDFTRYVRRVLRRRNIDRSPRITISRMAATAVDNMLKDIIEKVGEAAHDLLFVAGKSTLTHNSMAMACRMTLPPRIGHLARRTGRKALCRLMKSYHRHNLERLYENMTT